MQIAFEKFLASLDLKNEVADKYKNAPDVCKFITDSRALEPTCAANTVFFAINTATGNGERYVKDLYDRGVRIFVVSKSFDDGVAGSDAYIAKVDDPLKALQASAAYLRKKCINQPVVGITGSRGKTVVKELIRSMLQPSGVKVGRSPRSWNSQIGVPLSILQLHDADMDVAVVEAGISRTDEMNRLSSIIAPTVGIFTALTDEHDRGFASLEQKAREKAKLFADAQCDDIFYPADEPLIARVLGELYPDRRLHAVDGGNIELAKAVCCLLYPQVQLVEVSEVSTRIDIIDTADNMQVAYDHFTCDAQSIAEGLNIVRRRTAPGSKLIVVTSPVDDYFEGNNIKNHIVIGDNGSKYKTVDEFIADTDPSQFYNCTVYINGADKEAFAALQRHLSRNRHVTRLEINLDALVHNYRHYRALLPSQTGLIAMIKASAYGCGALEVARALQTQGADMAAVAVVDEGVELRRGGMTMPVLVLDPWCEDLRAIFANGLEPTLIADDEDLVRRLENAADAEGVTGEIRVHVKLDTGMHRVGLKDENEIDAFVDMLKRHPRLRVMTTFSHLATADCLDLDQYTQMQLENFSRMSAHLIDRLGYGVKRHVLNTAGITRYGDTASHYDFARLGIGLYGISPLDATDAAELRPVARLVTRIIALRHLSAGDKVGYGCHGVITRPTVIATIPVGYADGVNRRLGNGHAEFVVNGVKCPTVGNICMDLCMIDVTGCNGDYGDGSVEIFGEQARIERLAEATGTIPYEILTAVSPRVKRVYYRE